jgi:N-acetylgalactosamine-6-sulfatase
MNCTRRNFLAAGCASLLSRARGAADRPPNIIFLLADDLGWGDLSCYGNRRMKTPALDRMAQEGTRFTQFYVAAAVCSPSRASFLTGRFTPRHGVVRHFREKQDNLSRGMPRWLDPDQAMLPRLLKEAGYGTAHFGKWHLCSSDDPESPTPSRYGFDAHRVVVDNGDGLERLAPGTSGWNVWEGAKPGPRWHEWKSRSSEFIVDETIRFAEASKDRPFFINSWFFDPHAKLTPTARQMEPFGKYGTPFRIYYGAVGEIDRQVARLFRRLEELRLADNTLVLFTSDNGPEDIVIDNAEEHGVGDPGPFRGRKRSGYEGGIRMPFLVRWPKTVPAARVDESTVFSAVDFLPTLTALAGARTPSSAEIDGVDMTASLRGTSVERARPLFWDLREDTVGGLINKSPKLMIREGRWKLLMNPDGSNIELYDIVKNSLEVDNLADRNPDVVERLSRRLAAWKRNPAVTF